MRFIALIGTKRMLLMAGVLIFSAILLAGCGGGGSGSKSQSGGSGSTTKSQSGGGGTTAKSGGATTQGGTTR